MEYVGHNGGSAGNCAAAIDKPLQRCRYDGKDLGANVPGVNAVVAKVR